MANQQLATYLNNHLAASTAIIELLAQLQATHEGSDVGDFFATLHADILTERHELEALMQRLAISENTLRQRATWLVEKVTQLKLRLDSPTGEALRLLEALEVVATGLEGKRSLWQSLAVTAEAVPGLQGMDYNGLIEQTQAQQQRVGQLRLQVAKAAFVDQS